MNTNELTQNDVHDAFSNDSLHLILLSTEKCNFRCKYCYESFTRGKMEKNVISGVCNLISKRAKELNILKISWFGGEPLLAPDVIHEIMDYASTVCRINKVNLESDMTTNAYKLEKNILQSMCKNKISKYHISLDGDVDFHNRTRIRADGKDTFSKIWENLCGAKETNLDYQFILRLHVTTKNIFSILRLIDKIKEQFSSDPRFLISIRKIVNYRNDDQDIYISMDEFSELTTSLIKKANKFNLLRVDDISNQGVNNICYASKPNSLVIRPDGYIVKCTVALDNETNVIGKIDKEGRLAINNKKISFWAGGFISKDRDYLACPASKLTRNI